MAGVAVRASRRCPEVAPRGSSAHGRGAPMAPRAFRRVKNGAALPVWRVSASAKVARSAPWSMGRTASRPPAPRDRSVRCTPRRKGRETSGCGASHGAQVAGRPALRAPSASSRDACAPVVRGRRAAGRGRSVSGFGMARARPACSTTRRETPRVLAVLGAISARVNSGGIPLWHYSYRGYHSRSS